MPTARVTFSRKPFSFNPITPPLTAASRTITLVAVRAGTWIPKMLCRRASRRHKRRCSWMTPWRKRITRWGLAIFFYRWNWKAAEQESQKSIELDANYGEGYHLRGYVLLA